jgi:peroxiredoxin
VIRGRITWDTAFNEFWGQKAADFTFKDVNDNTHKLSDFRGRPVLVVFWATWCPPCREEIPGLINLRKTYDANSLAIVALSNEEAMTVKEFASERGINYIVAGIADAILPEPFGLVNGIPAGFFIDPNGVIKLATEGLMREKEVKSVIEAIK